MKKVYRPLIVDELQRKSGLGFYLSFFEIAYVSRPVSYRRVCGKVCSGGETCCVVSLPSS